MREIIKIFLGFFIIFTGVPCAQGQQEAANALTLRLMREQDVKEILSPKTSAMVSVPELQQKEITEEDLIAGQKDVVTGEEDTVYIIVPGDLLKISFRNGGAVETDDYQVSAEGFIYLPLAGPVKVSMYNKKQAREEINKALRLYIREPDAIIQINTSGKYLVLGQVTTKGYYAIKKGLRMFEALLLAGYSGSADLKSVLIIRGTEGKTVFVKVNVKKLATKGDRSDDILIKPGDIIIVPQDLMDSIWSSWTKVFDFAWLVLQKWYGVGGQNLVNTGTPFFGPWEYRNEKNYPSGIDVTT